MFKAVVIGDDMSGDRNSCSFILSQSEHAAAKGRAGITQPPRDYVFDPTLVSTLDPHQYSAGGGKDGSR